MRLLARTAARLLPLALVVALVPPATEASIASRGSLETPPFGAAMLSENPSFLAELPFGEEYNPQPGNQPLRFTGKERDTETGFDYFGARYYQAKWGRFTTTDPVYNWNENLLDPQRWNRYAYGRNNPFRYVDPDGRDNWDLALGFGQGIAQVNAAQSQLRIFGAAAPLVGAALGGAQLAQDAPLLAYGVTHPGAVINQYVQMATSANDQDQRALGVALGQGTAVAGVTVATGKAVSSVVGATAATGDVFASTPVGRLGSPLGVAPGTNAPATIGGRLYTGHALDRMQGRGLVPSVVEDTIGRGAQSSGRGGATVHTTEQARVILNPDRSVKTVYPQ